MFKQSSLFSAATLGGAFALLFALSVSMSAAADTRAQIRGSFLGLAFGDSWGAITENWKREDIQNVFGRMAPIPVMAPLDTIYRQVGEKQLLRTRRYGYTTDDTQQAGLLILVGLANKSWSRYAAADWAQAIIQGTHLNAWRGQGKKFMEAAHNLRAGADYKISGSDSAGIGGAMAKGVLGAVYRGDLISLRRATIESTLITHSDVRAVALAYAMSRSVYSLIHGRSVQQIREELPQQVFELENETKATHSGWRVGIDQPHQISQALTAIFKLNLSDPQAIADAVVQYAGKVTGQNPFEIHPNDPFSLIGGIHAVAQALAPEVNPLRTLQFIVEQGYDTDTVAAMAGSILGARLGDRWIPGEYMREYIRWSELADELADGDRGPQKVNSIHTYLMSEKENLVSESTFQNTCRVVMAALAEEVETAQSLAQ